jgi:hypothetical protein
VAPNSQSTQDNSSEINSRLAASLAQIDRDETEVVKRRGAIDQDLEAPSKNVELVDREADLLSRQQVLASQAFQQAIAGFAQSGSIAYQLQDLQNQSSANLDEMDALLDASGAQAREAAAVEAAANLQAAKDAMNLTSAEMDNFMAQMQASQQAYFDAIARNGG